jgi:hypothetical protein
VEWRISFFVHSAEATEDGWVVVGEEGLRTEPGDRFSVVHSERDNSEQEVDLLAPPLQ